jgi:hypothetical protein
VRQGIHVQNCRPASQNLQPSNTDRSLTTPRPPTPTSTPAAMLSRQVFRSLRAAAPQRAVALRAAPVRTFAAAASSDVKPPIAVFGLDGTYATALVCRSPGTMKERGRTTVVGFYFSSVWRSQLRTFDERQRPWTWTNRQHKKPPDAT